MHNHIRLLRKTLVSILLVSSATLCHAGIFAGDSWRDISEEDKAQTASTIDPEAGAEILYLEEKVNDNDPLSNGTIPHMQNQPGSESNRFARLHRYIRVKAFDERGVEKLKEYYTDVDSEFNVTDVAARVVQPDGSITLVDDRDIFKREVLRDGDNRIERISFAFPNLTPGSILEVQVQAYTRHAMSDLFFSFGAPLPIRDAVLLIKPSEGRLCYFNYNNIPGGVHAGWSDYHKAEVHNIHAYSDDPYQPPLLSQRPWISARYAYSKEETKPDKYWMYYSMFLDDWSRFKVGGGVDIRKKADVLTGGITDPKERLRRLYNFCQSEIVNTDCENSGFLASDIRGLGKNDNSAETLSNARGNTTDISLLFASLARAAGFEVNLALCNDKTLIDWDPKALNYRMVPEFLVAVKDGEKWGFYEPGIPFLPFGMIRPGNEMTTAILGHPDKATLVQTPFAPSSASQLIRAGTFSIDEDGTLHGEATFKYSGHRARQAKNDWVGMSQEDREDDFKSSIRDLVPNAEISD
ncbi:MAG TPA: DUF3857 domain-containing protein, partial [Opitutales bacterium]|nr:DUF3857 domain-containing protein [Opitutales bacterium]